MSEKKPVATFAKTNNKTCPVCRKPSYSRDGIHPQCAVSQADALRRADLNAIKKVQLEEK